MTITLYGTPNCDTVKRARAWLVRQGATVAFHDFKKTGVPANPLEVWLQSAGRQRLLNCQGNHLAQAGCGHAVRRGRCTQRPCADACAGQRDQAAGGSMGRRQHHRGL